MAVIIVAGAGHGGIAAAALLAKKGYDVTVYERSAEGKLGYDWTDIFSPGALKFAEIPMPAREKYAYKENMTFFNPDKSCPLTQNVAEDKLEIKMERRDIYDLLISHALECGVKFIYECNIEAPILSGNRVTGIKTSLGDFYGDLVIDAAGLNSPLRSRLPSVCGIINNVKRFEKFYVYRAFYNRISCQEKQENYRVYLFPDGETGIGWVATESDFTDVLIGKFDELSDEGIENTLRKLREHNPQLGEERLRGGQRVQIPVRQPLSVLVCDGYAAIGDSAFMTVPIIGSGIANSLKAAKFLADTVTADRDCAFSAETLWSYQKKYYRKLGSGFAVLAIVKLLLTIITPEQLDFIFKNKILTANEFTIDADTTNLLDLVDFNIPDLMRRARRLFTDKKLLGEIIAVGGKIAAATAVCAAMPLHYSKRSVSAWAKRYDAIF